MTTYETWFACYGADRTVADRAYAVYLAARDLARTIMAELDD